MRLRRIYECLCDETRLRIINLLLGGPLCVCHLQEILGQSQVNVSRHLAYLKARHLVEAKRHHNWMIYRLPAKRPLELEAHLECLEACRPTEPALERDVVRLRRLLDSRGVQEVLAASGCCGSAQPAAEAREESSVSWL